MAISISPATSWIAGLSVSAAALCFGYFYFAKPNKAEEDAYKEQKTKYEAVISQKPQAEARVKDVSEKIVAELAKWRDIVNTKTPPEAQAAGGFNLAENPWQLVIDARSYRNRIQDQINSQIKIGGVDVLVGPTVPAFSQDPTSIIDANFNYPGLKYPVLVMNLGQVTVRGTYEQIATNFNAWNNMPRYLAVCDGLQITGTSPNLTGVYSVYLVGYIRGEKVGAPVPDGGSPAAGASAPAGGGFGGPGGPAGGGGGAPLGPAMSGATSVGGPAGGKPMGRSAGG